MVFRKLGFGGFRVRSRERDLETDANRFKPITAAIDQAMQQAQFERESLHKRLLEARTRASFLVGNGTDDYEFRDEKELQLLRESEQQMIAATRRLEELKQQIQALEELRTRYDNLFPAANSPVG